MVTPTGTAIAHAAKKPGIVPNVASVPPATPASGADVICYGAPVLPGAMFSLAYFADGTPVMGLPGCVMYAKTTIFDLVLPRITADIPITKHELKGLGHGGLCLNCPVCHYPNCSFGKGV